MRIVTCSQMKEAENFALNNGISSMRLMENAGSAAARFIRDTVTVSGGSFCVVCGKGNNGGDGFVAARKLIENGAEVRVVLACGASSTTDAIEMLERLRGLDAQIIDFSTNPRECIEAIKNSSYIIDAVFGTGFKGTADINIGFLFNEINNSFAKVFSLDMPSGANAGTGEVAGSCVKADYTITFAAPKIGQYTFPAANYCGAVRAVNIGITEKAFEAFGNSVELIEMKMLSEIIPVRQRDANKGDYGRLLCICGSRGMSGAAYLSATAALKCGAGLVTAFVPDSIYLPIASKFNEIMVYPIKETDYGSADFENYEKIISQKADCILIGCGLSQNESTFKLVREIIKNAECPIVLDADGINAFVGHIDLLRDSKADIILTPHPGEMARLINQSVSHVQSSRLDTAVSFAAQIGVYVVLKGANTVIVSPEGKTFINPTGNPGMAKGGSGDILAGMIASFAAQGFSLANAAVCAAYIHGLAGDRCADEFSQYGMTPSDMLTEIPQIFREISR